MGYIEEYMGKSELLQLNKKLSEYLIKKDYDKSFYYAPCVPDLYWNCNKRIAICNLETYCTDKKDYENYKNIQTIKNEILQQWSYGNQTIAKTFFYKLLHKENYFWRNNKYRF